MIHSINELYNVYNCGRTFLATSNYIKTFNISTTKEKVEAAKLSGNIYALRALSHTNNGTATVHDVYTQHTIFMFGEKTWFDTEQERNEYRQAYHAEREAKANRKRIMDDIIRELNKLSDEQLREILATL